MFGRSLICESSAFSFGSSYSTTTVTSADFLTSFHLVRIGVAVRMFVLRIAKRHHTRTRCVLPDGENMSYSATSTNEQKKVLHDVVELEDNI